MKRILVSLIMFSPLLIGGVIGLIVGVSELSKKPLPEYFIDGNASWFDANMIIDEKYSVNQISTLAVVGLEKYASKNFSVSWKLQPIVADGYDAFDVDKIYINEKSNKSYFTIESKNNYKEGDYKLPNGYITKFKIIANASASGFKSRKEELTCTLKIAPKIPDFVISGDNGLGAGTLQYDEDGIPEIGNYSTSYSIFTTNVASGSGIGSDTLINLGAYDVADYERTYEIDSSIRFDIDGVYYYNNEGQLQPSDLIEHFSLSGLTSISSTNKKTNYIFKIGADFPRDASCVVDIVANAYKFPEFAPNKSKLRINVGVDTNFPNSIRLVPRSTEFTWDENDQNQSPDYHDNQEIHPFIYNLRSMQLVGASYSDANFIFDIVGISLSSIQNLDIIWSIASSANPSLTGKLLISPSTRKDYANFKILSGIPINTNVSSDDAIIECTLKINGTSPLVYKKLCTGINFSILNTINSDVPLVLNPNVTDRNRINIDSADPYKVNVGYGNTDLSLGLNINLSGSDLVSPTVVYTYTFQPTPNCSTIGYISGSRFYIIDYLGIGEFTFTIKYTIYDESHAESTFEQPVTIVVKKVVPDFTLEYRLFTSGGSYYELNDNDTFYTQNENLTYSFKPKFSDAAFAGPIDATDFTMSYQSGGSWNNSTPAQATTAYNLTFNASSVPIGVYQDVITITVTPNHAYLNQYFSLTKEFHINTNIFNQIPHFTIVGNNTFNKGPNQKQSILGDPINGSTATNPYRFQRGQGYTKITEVLSPSIIFDSSRYTFETGPLQYDQTFTGYNKVAYNDSNKTLTVNTGLNNGFSNLYHINFKVYYNSSPGTYEQFNFWFAFEVLPPLPTVDLTITDGVYFLPQGITSSQVVLGNFVFNGLPGTIAQPSDLNISILCYSTNIINQSYSLTNPTPSFSITTPNSLIPGVYKYEFIITITHPSYLTTTIIYEHELEIHKVYSIDGHDWPGRNDISSPNTAIVHINTTNYSAPINGVTGAAYISEVDKTYVADNLHIPVYVKDASDNIFTIVGFKRDQSSGVLYANFFKQCLNITGALYLPDSIEKIGFDDGLNDNIFSTCSNVTAVYFGRNLEYISKNSFRNCLKIEYLDFSKCVNLPWNIDDTVEYGIHGQAFANLYASGSFSLNGTTRKVIGPVNGQFNMKNKLLEISPMSDRYSFFGSDLSVVYWEVI